MKVIGMTRKNTTSRLMALALAGTLALAGCDGTGVTTTGTVYYDSLLWNDYYYGSYRPDYNPPSRPDRPDRPDRPARPPGGGIDPGFSRPPVARPPVHRPAGGGGGLRGRR